MRSQETKAAAARFSSTTGQGRERNREKGGKQSKTRNGRFLTCLRAEGKLSGRHRAYDGTGMAVRTGCWGCG